MSINYSSVIGVGVEEDEITYQSLTEIGKNIIKDAYLNYLNEDERYDEKYNRISDEELLRNVDLIEWFINNIGEYDLWFELGLEKYTGNCFSGETGYRGVEVDLNNIEEAKERFKKVVNLEPQVFNGVLVW